MNEAPAQFIYTEELYKLPGRVLVLLPVPWETLPEAEVTLLGKILNAVKLSLAGVQIICREKTDLRELNVFNPAAIISFGTALTPDVERYTAGEVDGVRIIHSDVLSALDDAKKKSLWNALRQAFA